MKNYGFNRATDPEYWRKTSGAIHDDGALSLEEKFTAYKELIDEYYKEKRDKTARGKVGMGEFVGPRTKEVVAQELFSLKNNKFEKLKPGFAKKVKALEAELATFD